MPATISPDQSALDVEPAGGFIVLVRPRLQGAPGVVVKGAVLGHGRPGRPIGIAGAPHCGDWRRRRRGKRDGDFNAENGRDKTLGAHFPQTALISSKSSVREKKNFLCSSLLMTLTGLSWAMELPFICIISLYST